MPAKITGEFPYGELIYLLIGGYLITGKYGQLFV